MTTDRNDGVRPYLKVFPEEYTGGSLHYGCTLEERGFFMDLLCEAAKNRKERGTLSLEKGVPMTDNMIANALFISLDDCRRLLDVMFKQDRIERRADDVILIKNFDFYQNRYRRSNQTKEKQKNYAIKKKAEERLRKLINQHPKLSFEIVAKDFGCEIINKSTGEIYETIKEDDINE